MLKNKRVLITGGAGFVGSHMVERLAPHNRIIVLDNLSTGKRGNMEKYIGGSVDFHKIDVLADDLTPFFRGVEHVFHFSADADVRMNEGFSKSFDQNFTATRKVLEECRKNNVKRFCFTSSCTVYGEAETPTPESYGPLKPISLYGASKLASEAIISGYSYAFGISSVVFRLANVIGRGCHGVVPDFVSKLKKNPSRLEILGNGMQKKSYIYIDDCIDAMLSAIEAPSVFDVFNIGSEDQVIVKRIAEIVSEEMKLNPSFSYTGGSSGWKGDVPIMMLDIGKIKRLGWKPKYGSEEAVRRTVRGII